MQVFSLEFYRIPMVWIRVFFSALRYLFWPSWNVCLLLFRIGIVFALALSPLVGFPRLLVPMSLIRIPLLAVLW